MLTHVGAKANLTRKSMLRDPLHVPAWMLAQPS